eukprot:COSAG01_NODE_2796_length_7058_cov_12.294295_13_plen_147_part_00
MTRRSRYDAKLSEAQQRIHRLEQQLQSTQQQMQQLKQSRGGMMGGGGGVLRGGLQGGMQGGGMQGGGMQGGMSKFGQRPAQSSFGAISKVRRTCPAVPAATNAGSPVVLGPPDPVLAHQKITPTQQCSATGVTGRCTGGRSPVIGG